MVTDAELVTAYVDGGRRDALAAIYDRHAAAVHDTAVAMTRDRVDAEDLTHDVFLTAAERMSQLRDRTKLRPWLFAILRHAVYARSRGRSRTTTFDSTGDDMDTRVSPTPPGDEPDDRLVAEELAAEVRAAARGLDERDQLVLELVARQQLGGSDLAAALGVSVEQSYVVVSRMRERVERSLGALVVARTGRTRCGELASLLTDWDGELTVLLRKRVARHVERCDVCEETRRRTAVLPLISLAPAAVLPARLRERVLADAALVRPAAPPTAAASRSTLRRRGLAVAAAIALVVAGGVALANVVAPATPEVDGAAEIGTTTSPATTAVVATTATAPPADAPPAATAPEVVAPTAPPPPAPTATTAPAGPPTTMDPPVVGPGVLVAPSADDEAPRVTMLSTPITLTCDRLDRLIVRAGVADASRIEGVELTWLGPGEPGEVTMTRATDGTWSARPVLDPIDGDWLLSVTATDAAGNDGSDQTTVVVTGCS